MDVRMVTNGISNKRVADDRIRPLCSQIPGHILDLKERSLLAPLPTSGFRGVYHRPDQRWQAQIQVKGKLHVLGCFDEELSAAHAYDRAAKEVFAVSVLNFHEDGTLNPERKKGISRRLPKTSRFRGVSLTGSGRWHAQIASKKGHSSLGFFTDEKEAAKAYDRAAKRYHRWPVLNFPDDEVRDVSAQPPAMMHKSSGADQEDLGWSSSDEENEGGPGQQSDGSVPPCKRSRSSSGAVAIASPHSPTATAAATAANEVTPIDLTLEDNDRDEDLKGMPPDTSASAAAHAASPSSSSTSTPAASSATPASPLSSSISSAAAASTSSSPHEGPAIKSTSDAVEQLYHAVMKARMEARDAQQKAMLKKACTIFNDPMAADAVLAFARRTVTNAFGAVDLRSEEHRTTVVEMFIEQLVEE